MFQTEKGVRQRGQRKHKFKELERERGKDREARAAVPLSFDYVDRPVLSTDLEKATWTASTKRPSFHCTHTHTHGYVYIYTNLHNHHYKYETCINKHTHAPKKRS